MLLNNALMMSLIIMMAAQMAIKLRVPSQSASLLEGCFFTTQMAFAPPRYAYYPLTSDMPLLATFVWRVQHSK
jgi:hypothetical protein